MAEKVEDLNLPISVVSRLIKDTLPEGANVSKEARTAIARAASVFVLYLTSSSNNVALKSKRKVINNDDVFQAIVETEFEMFEGPLREAYEEFKKTQKLKKDAAAKKKLSLKENKKADEDANPEDESEIQEEKEEDEEGE